MEIFKFLKQDLLRNNLNRSFIKINTEEIADFIQTDGMQCLLLKQTDYELSKSFYCSMNDIPLLTDIFKNNHTVYIETYKEYDKPIYETHLIYEEALQAIKDIRPDIINVFKDNCYTKTFTQKKYLQLKIFFDLYNTEEKLKDFIQQQSS